MFYLERVVHEVMSTFTYFLMVLPLSHPRSPDGDGEVETDMFAKFPYTPSDTPVPTPRRRIRCKMCRYAEE